MVSSVQARLDPESQHELEQLSRKLGWSPSKVVREGIHLLAACHRTPAARRIIGLGQFASGKPDLGSDKRRLEGFGR